MNGRPELVNPEPTGSGTWLDAYMPAQLPATQAAAAPMVNIDFVRGILYRQRWVIAGVMFAAVTIGLIATLLMTPMYEARAKVAIKPFGEQVVEGQSGIGVPGNMLYEYAGTMIQRIGSRRMAAVVVDDLKLTDRQELLGSDIESKRKPGMTDAQWQDAKREIVIDELVEALRVSTSPGSFVIDIGVRLKNPVLAAQISNAYADAFVASDTRTSLESSRYALSYLSEQIEQTRARLQTAEEASNEYARSRGIITQASGGDTENAGTAATLTNSKLTSINQRYIEARAARIAAEQR